MKIKVGTFNVNNLFSRFDFDIEVDQLPAKDQKITVTISGADLEAGRAKARTYLGRLVKGKDPKKRAVVAKRIKDMDCHILALQEVEDIDTLRAFNDADLSGLYDYVVLVEGNDDRLIDVALLSKLPLSAVTSWRHLRQPSALNKPIFSRDLLQVEVQDPGRTRTLFTIFNNHLKSQFVPFNSSDAAAEKEAADKLRKLQAETVARIIKERMKKRDHFIVLGDMNDAPDANPMRPLTADPELRLVNALTSPREIGRMKVDKDDPPPSTKAWTHRFDPSKAAARYELFDQIWLSSTLAKKQTDAAILRRTLLNGDGSDHDPAFIELSI